MVEAIEVVYDSLAQNYDSKYVDDKNSSYMQDERDASYHFSMQKYDTNSKIISLGCGTGQDYEIIGRPKNYTGYDISSNMLDKARVKFPNVNFIKHDCNKIIIDENYNIKKCDILVSMFGVPNYIHTWTMIMHYLNMEAKHAFFVFYNENYDDGIFGHHNLTKNDLYDRFNSLSDSLYINDLSKNSNYTVVAW